MERGEDPQGSTWLWARRRAREHVRGFVLVVVVLPIASAVLGALIGPSAGATVSDHVWWAALPFVAVLVVVIAGTVLVSLYRASFEQRSVLVTEISDLRLRVKGLVAERSSEPVKSEHAVTIKRILETAKLAVESGRRIPFEIDTDKSVIVGHFEELKPLIDEWDNLVYESIIREHQLIDRFDTTMNTLALGPPFAREAFRKFLDVAKQKAREQSLNIPYTIYWRDNAVDDDIHFLEGLIMTREGLSVAQADPTKMELTAEAIRTRTQEFVNQMMDWSELREYGDLSKMREYEKYQRELLSKLKFCVELDGYVRGKGCIRCPQS